MTDELPQWDFTPTPTAARDARVREVLLAYYRDDLDPLLRLIQDTATRDDITEVLIAFCKVCRATTDHHLAIARLVADLATDRAAAIEEAQP